MDGVQHGGSLRSFPYMFSCLWSDFHADTPYGIKGVGPVSPIGEHRHRNLETIKVVPEGHAAYTPLHYVLLFPYGESGWYYELRCPNNSRCIALLQYTAYRIHSRSNEFSTILCGCRLFQRYLVDMFACIDQQQLYFIRSQQKRLGVTLLNGLEDMLSMNDDQIDLNHLGQCIILPSSYLRGPHWNACTGLVSRKDIYCDS